MVIEPSADLRAFAKNMFETYTALIGAGFEDTQAMYMITEIIRSTIDKEG